MSRLNYCFDNDGFRLAARVDGWATVSCETAAAEIYAIRFSINVEEHLHRIDHSVLGSISMEKRLSVITTARQKLVYLFTFWYN